jgi:2,3-bisphosphoglycerate-dependent phosphoglycerate mutase
VSESRLPGALDVAFLVASALESPVTELVLVRHGQQALPDMRSNPISAMVDPPLSEIGERQAELVGKRFASERVDAVYVSTLQRAADTGRAIAQHHGIESVVVPDLREVEMFRDVPQDRRPIDVLDRRTLLGARARFIAERRWSAYPLSETSEELRDRIVLAIEGIVAEHPGERVVIACHGGVIASYVSHICALATDMVFRPRHTSVSIVLAGDGRRIVDSLNDVHHLRADPDAEALVTA